MRQHIVAVFLSVVGCMAVPTPTYAARTWDGRLAEDCFWCGAQAGAFHHNDLSTVTPSWKTDPVKATRFKELLDAFNRQVNETINDTLFSLDVVEAQQRIGNIGNAYDILVRSDECFQRILEAIVATGRYRSAYDPQFIQSTEEFLTTVLKGDPSLATRPNLYLYYVGEAFQGWLAQWYNNVLHTKYADFQSEPHAMNMMRVAQELQRRPPVDVEEVLTARIKEGSLSHDDVPAVMEVLGIRHPLPPGIAQALDAAEQHQKENAWPKAAESIARVRALLENNTSVPTITQGLASARLDALQQKQQAHATRFQSVKRMGAVAGVSVLALTIASLVSAYKARHKTMEEIRQMPWFRRLAIRCMRGMKLFRYRPKA